MRRRISSGWEIESLQRSIDELFELLATPASAPQAGWTPALDLLELPEELIVRVDLPGVRLEDLELRLRDRELQLSGSKRAAPASPEERRYHRMERGFGPFTVEVLLPSPVRADACRAVLRSGVLEVVLPRRDDPRHVVHSITIEHEEP